MSTYKKTIVLNNSKSSNFNGSAILTLTNIDGGVFGSLKTFNVSNSPNLVLGMAQNKKQVFKQNINLINNSTYNFKLKALNLNEPISCVLVLDEPDKVIPLIWGSDNRNELKEEIIENLSILKNQVSKTEINKKEINLDEMFDLSDADEVVDKFIAETEHENLDNNTSNTITNATQNLNFDSETLDSHNAYDVCNSISKVLNHKNIIEEELENLELEPNETFFETIAEQVENLFSSYPAESSLEELIPNSKWVKIDYENDGNFYVLGLIYEDITLKYICYGVPGTYANTAPNGLDSYSQWLPTDINNPQDGGYWVMYQDALTGESVLIDAI